MDAPNPLDPWQSAKGLLSVASRRLSRTLNSSVRDWLRLLTSKAITPEVDWLRNDAEIFYMRSAAITSVAKEVIPQLLPNNISNLEI